MEAEKDLKQELIEMERFDRSDEEKEGEDEYEPQNMKTNVIQSMFNIIKLAVGIGILAGPHAFSQGGLIGGIIGITAGKIDG